MNNRFFWGILFLLVVARFLHFGTLIDEPHDWRQSDTAFYIYDFYKNGIDLLEPAVCWMGNYERVIFEFPLPEAIVAFFYQIFGEHLPIARFIFYLFFLGAVYFFHQIVQLIFGKKTAQWATLVYLSLPLSWFYSRAIHIDFSAIMAAHAMLYFYLKGISKRNFTALIWSSFWATLVFLIKVPYAFYLALPMLAFAWKENAIGWMLKRAAVFVLPLSAFLLWQQYVYHINGQAPDWDYILHYRKFDNNNSWYFGSWARRIDFNAWKILTKRGILEVIGLGGIIFFFLGIKKFKKIQNAYFLFWWMLGVIIYVLVFFNLNVIHNYYQLPLLAPAAILIAHGLKNLGEKNFFFSKIGFLILIICNVIFAELTYFKVPHHLVEIGQQIKTNTNPDDLLIITYKKFDCRNPRILYRARRRGWSIEEQALNQEVLSLLQKKEGATVWVFIGQELPNNLDDSFLPNPKIIPLEESKERLFLFYFKK